MSKLDILLSKLQSKRTGRDSYMAICPAHPDKTPSLAIREIEPDHILLHCFAGCETEHVLGAIGLSFSDIMPDRARDETRKPQQIPFNARDVLAAVHSQSIKVLIYAKDIQAGKVLSKEESLELAKTIGRISAAAEMAKS